MRVNQRVTAARFCTVAGVDTGGENVTDGAQPAGNRRVILPRRGRGTWSRSSHGWGRVRSWLTVWQLLRHGTSRGLLRFDRGDSTHRMKQSDPVPASCVSPLPA